MLKKAFASGIAIVAVVGLVTGPASARHKMHYKHGQTTGMSTTVPNGGPTVSHGRGGGGSPSGTGGGAAGSGNAGGGGVNGK